MKQITAHNISAPGYNYSMKGQCDEVSSTYIYQFEDKKTARGMQILWKNFFVKW